MEIKFDVKIRLNWDKKKRISNKKIRVCLRIFAFFLDHIKELFWMRHVTTVELCFSLRKDEAKFRLELDGILERAFNM